MTVTYELHKGQKLTAEQIRELEDAKKLPITFDEDSPELSPAMGKAFRCSAARRNRQARKQAV